MHREREGDSISYSRNGNGFNDQEDAAKSDQFEEARMAAFLDEESLFREEILNKYNQDIT